MTLHMKSRRKMLAGFLGLMGFGALGGRAAATVRTPDATEGPYYPRPEMRKRDVDNDLVKIKGLVEKAGGEVFNLRGKLVGSDGQPLAGHRIEIWQCDVDGNYMHPRDRGSANFDRAFQGFGHDITDDAGNYSFRTIKPTIYPGRTPHIHVKIFDEDRELLTTQIYIKGHPNNVLDRLFNRMSTEQADAVSMTFMEIESGLEASVDLLA